MSQLEILGPDSWKNLIDSDTAVLAIGKSDCEACNAWSAELETWLAGDEVPEGVRFGKLLLDQRGLIEFKKASPWLIDVDVLPFNVIYRSGAKVKEFAGSGIDRLVNRIKRIQ